MTNPLNTRRELLEKAFNVVADIGCDLVLLEEAVNRDDPKDKLLVRIRDCVDQVVYARRALGKIRELDG